MFKKNIDGRIFGSRKSENSAIKYRKELLRKNKSQLIALCKKNRLSTFGTKSDMIDRLIQKKENKLYVKKKRK